MTNKTKIWPKDRPFPKFKDFAEEAKWWDEWRIDPTDPNWEELHLRRPMRTLKERLEDWTDFDGAEYELAVVLGLAPEFGAGPGKDPWHGLKGIFWSRNPTGETLYKMLQHLTKIGALLMDPENQKFRWNPDFVITE